MAATEDAAYDAGTMCAASVSVPGDPSVRTRLDDGRRVQEGIASVFDRAAGYYRDMRWEKNRVTRLEKWLTRQVLVEELGDGPAGSALEIGCGPGTWTPLLAEKAGEVTALDLSEKMLERAREAVREPNVTFVQGDAASFVTDRAFDRVMSVRVLEYVPEWRSIVRRLEDLVAPGGRAVIVTKTPISLWRGTGRERWFGPHTMARRLTGRKLDPEFWQTYIPVREMCRAFAEAGTRRREGPAGHLRTARLCPGDQAIPDHSQAGRSPCAEGDVGTLALGFAARRGDSEGVTRPCRVLRRLGAATGSLTWPPAQGPRPNARTSPLCASVLAASGSPW